jgi:hypothetical protein
MNRFNIENLEDLVVVAKSMNEALEHPEFTRHFFVSVNLMLSEEITTSLIKEYKGDNDFLRLHAMSSDHSYALRIYNIVFNIKADPDSPKPVKNIYNFSSTK